MSKEPASATIGHIGVAVMEKGGNAARVGGSELITVGVHDRRQDSGYRFAMCKSLTPAQNPFGILRSRILSEGY